MCNVLNIKIIIRCVQMYQLRYSLQKWLKLVTNLKFCVILVIKTLKFCINLVTENDLFDIEF